MRVRTRVLLGAGTALALIAAAWLAHAPALPRTWQAIRPGMPAAEAERILGPAALRQADGVRLDAEVPGDPLLHGRRRWLIVDLEGDPAASRVARVRHEDGLRAEWLYRVPGLASLL